MGCGHTSQRDKIIDPHNIGKLNLKYPNHIRVKIKQKDNSGKETGFKSISFNLKTPFIYSSHSPTQPKLLHYSLCTLPGCDPAGTTEKKCQDICGVFSTPKSMLLALFDGHGKDGEKIVDVCLNIVKDFYLNNFERFEANFKGLLEEICKNCDEGVKRRQEIDSSNSGSTAVLVLVCEDGIHSASLGDSRALLVSSEAPKVMPVTKAPNRDETKHLYPKNEALFPVQLTKDQKPEDPEEHARIRECGGTIKRIIQNGKQTGPYRVVDSSGQYPLLAMSRSIGDSSGSSIGVISTPIYTYLPLSGKEKFIVLGSDGIWDVMDNEDVATFVETYRKKCISEGSPPLEVNCSNTIIAHLLCEEARIRWLKVVADEDALIDDISAIVLQFKEE